jgi:XTP/dITP diphosphohydrolase
MPMQLVIATTNAGKRREFEALLSGRGFEVLSLDAFPPQREPDESGLTFAENALIKARTAAARTGLWALADDSGLCVDALDGRPGLHSARYAEGSDQTRWQKLLGELASVPDERRTAHFTCALALVSPGGREAVVEGRCDGRIGRVPRGDLGFGYDPVFIVASDLVGRTMAELTGDEKQAAGHRGRAFAALLPHLALVAGRMR